MEQFKPAGFGRRLGAYLIDIIPLVLLSLFLLYLIRGSEFFDADDWSDTDSDVISPKIALRYFAFLLWIVYCAIMEATKYQGTVGKVLMDIKVVNASGSRLTIIESIIRNLTKILSYLPLALGFLWMLFNKKRRCWHDFLAGTFVVEDSKESKAQIETQP